MIHNAAHLFIGMAEGFTAEQLADSINTNAVGAHRLNRAALPHMRKHGSGVLLYVGSGITRIVSPFMMPYVAGKYAMDAFAEATAYEVGPLGTETVIVMPGVFMDGTSHFATAVFPADKAALGGYDKLRAEYDRYEPGLRNLFRGGCDAPVQGVADEIARVLALPRGRKPMRTTVDYSDYGAEPVNSVAQAQTERVFRIMGFDRLLELGKCEASGDRSVHAAPVTEARPGFPLSSRADYPRHDWQFSSDHHRNAVDGAAAEDGINILYGSQTGKDGFLGQRPRGPAGRRLQLPSA